MNLKKFFKYGFIIFALLWVVIIAQHIYVHSIESSTSEKPKTEKKVLDISPLKTGIYIAIWSNGAERFTIRGDGTYLYEWIGKDGSIKSFENIYTITHVNRSYLLSNSTQYYSISDVPWYKVKELIEKWDYKIKSVRSDFALDLNLKRDSYIAYG